jgi:hypothetical protein
MAKNTHMGIRHNVEVDIRSQQSAPQASIAPPTPATTPVVTANPESIPSVSPITADTSSIKEEETKPEILQQKAVNIEKLSQALKDNENSIPLSDKVDSMGIAGDNILEPVPQYINTPSEIVQSNKNNSWIVLGRDRPGSRLSGYGGSGDSAAASIDIVAGRMGYEVATVNDLDEQLFVDPSFKKDSARIYISQKSDIDEYFGLIEGKVGNSKTKSAIGIKADGVRIIAREGIKLVTGTDVKNSQGAKVRTISGVDIIAGNEDQDLQPMVKGTNILQAMDRLSHHVDKLAGIVDAFLHIQMEYNKHIATHWHTSPFFAVPTLPSEILVPEGSKCLMNQLTKVKRGLLDFKINLASYRVTYLTMYGKAYICSRHNNVN